MTENIRALAGLTVNKETRDLVSTFIKDFDPVEVQAGIPLLILRDDCCGAFYCLCHLSAKTLAAKADTDAVLDPLESEEYKLNRELYTDTYAYQVMERDALKGRRFEDLVVEYDKSYRTEKPLKVFGGQHRIKAITEASKKNVVVAHGLRVYFNLTTQQRLEIATVNNISIAVPNDLLDRMQEEGLGSDLRDWCQRVGLLQNGQNFADRRSAEGLPTVRIARTLIVNFSQGRSSQGKEHVPLVCSSGPRLDEDYQRVRHEIDWHDKALATMGKEFTRLQSLQRQRVLDRKKDHYVEFANKALHPSIAAGWAFAAGLFQSDEKALAAHYGLPESCNPPADPLNAKALLEARLEGVDPENYRGLGSRINQQELGRVLEVFILQATKVKKPGITAKVANVAIKSYEAKKKERDFKEALKSI